MLSCDCGDPFDADEFFFAPKDYSIYDRDRGKRCKSCGHMIRKGDVCIEFERERYPVSDVEASIYGEGEPVALASWYWCEACADQYWNLTDLGFCFGPDESAADLLNEYREMTAYEKKERE